MDLALFFTLFEGPSFFVNYRLMVMLHLGYESTALIHGRTNLEVLNFGQTCSYGLQMCGPVTTG